MSLAKDRILLHIPTGNTFEFTVYPEPPWSSDMGANLQALEILFTVDKLQHILSPIDNFIYQCLVLSGNLSPLVKSNNLGGYKLEFLEPFISEEYEII